MQESVVTYTTGQCDGKEFYRSEEWSGEETDESNGNGCRDDVGNAFN